ncbi:hypothetical protein [Janthinobacterium sp.]|uniref:hypothetical protein n=1 Tax=Janthinobacterium sp. TaxID=1871054 RepID=UPI00293D4DBB|nr:hypothetical protein [Janthinobacterium sp.]
MNNLGIAIGEKLVPVAFDPDTLDVIYKSESGAKFTTRCSTAPDMFGDVITAETWREALGYLPLTSSLRLATALRSERDLMPERDLMQAAR